ncbi:hypothetical protein AJ78_01707 [Emergomyces pasteurianus Ep9510]|uniref:Uncharacterized protein n=1 Tax=Emergomyces pasteurianus Ep9510 TaxID=1447872 RepID=A0A1J9QQW6_9EURO|nr:hypothetical protein AJ78_01707 [Emergomyces pasteurianus Ep9510]
MKLRCPFLQKLFESTSTSKPNIIAIPYTPKPKLRILLEPQPSTVLQPNPINTQADGRKVERD